MTKNNFIYQFTKLLLLSFLLVLSLQKKLDQQPVIGIYTQPAHFEEYQGDKYQYILQANVEFIQKAGGQVVAVPYDGTEQQLKTIFENINGLLFTGGGLNLDINTPMPNSDKKYNIYTKNAEYLVNLAIQANKQGDFFPIWGNCQGFELLNYIQSGYKDDVLQHISDDENVTRMGDFDKYSRLFEKMSTFERKYPKTHSILFYYHELAVYPSVFEKYSQLSDFYEITGYSTNGADLYEGDRFIASMEAKEYPIYALQFHPEYTLYNENMNTNKSVESKYFAKYFGEFFVDIARNSTHKYDQSNQLLNNITVQNFELVYFPDGFFQYIFFIKNSKFQVSAASE